MPTRCQNFELPHPHHHDPDHTHLPLRSLRPFRSHRVARDAAAWIESRISAFGPDRPSVDGLCGIAGGNVASSLSPRLHHRAYHELGLAWLYLPLPFPLAGAFTPAWRALRSAGEDLGLPWHGLTVVAPAQEEALEAAATASPTARRAQAANVLARGPDGGWHADTTDPQGILEPLAERGVDVGGRTAAVLGAGGAGRTLAVALAEAGARVTLVHRRRESSRLAAELGVGFLLQDALRPERFDLLLNATPVGRDGDAPIDLDRLDASTTVVDLVYSDGPTPLITAARERGSVTVDGREVLLAETRAQLLAHTGRVLPVDRLRAFLVPG